jgi:hypothetical protein
MLTKGNQNYNKVSHTYGNLVYFLPDAASPLKKIKLTSFVPGALVKLMKLALILCSYDLWIVWMTTSI